MSRTVSRNPKKRTGEGHGQFFRSGVFVPLITDFFVTVLYHSAKAQGERSASRESYFLCPGGACLCDFADCDHGV